MGRCPACLEPGRQLGATNVGTVSAKVALMGLAGLVLSLVGMGTAMALSGQATPLQIGMQDPATPVAVEIYNFYSLVNTIIVAIAIFVLILMLVVMYRFNESRIDAVQDRPSHDARSGVDGGADLHPHRDRHPLVQAAEPAIHLSSASIDHQGDR